MPLYPKIVSDPATPKRCSLNDRVAVTGEARDAYGAATSFLRSSRLPDEVDEAAGGTAFATNLHAFSGRGCWPAGGSNAGCLPWHWLKSYATAVAVASLAWLAGPEEARGFDLFGLFRSNE